RLLPLSGKPAPVRRRQPERHGQLPRLFRLQGLLPRTRDLHSPVGAQTLPLDRGSAPRSCPPDTIFGWPGGVVEEIAWIPACAGMSNGEASIPARCPFHRSSVPRSVIPATVGIQWD